MNDDPRGPAAGRPADGGDGVDVAEARPAGAAGRRPADDPPGRPAPRRRGRTLRLVLVGAAAVGAAGCEPERPEPVFRPLYASAESCQEDWGTGDLCEPVADGAAAAASAASSTGHRSGGHSSGGTYFRGPYYSTLGHYYGYDGQVHRFARPPSRMIDAGAAMMTERSIHATPGRYAATPLHPSVASRHSTSSLRSAISRGGFGRSGFSSSG